MGVNLDKPQNWKADILQSVDMYNNWFMTFAPKTFRDTRVATTKEVVNTLNITQNHTKVTPEVILMNPSIVSTLRMSTCPPIAVDRLIGLSGTTSSLVKRLELKKLPVKLKEKALITELTKICEVVNKMLDPDIFFWLSDGKKPDKGDIERAATIVADRLCGAVADPIIRNAQEKRQLTAMKTWLEENDYREVSASGIESIRDLEPGTFCFRLNIPVHLDNGDQVNTTVDAVVNPSIAYPNDLPYLFEAKSAGDYTNVNKRRKEEAAKMTQLKKTYGRDVRFILFLCGYFDSGYLGYEAAEGIDWIWEHRVDDLKILGL